MSIKTPALALSCVCLSYLSCTTITNKYELESRWGLRSFGHSGGVDMIEEGCAIRDGVRK